MHLRSPSSKMRSSSSGLARLLLFLLSCFAVACLMLSVPFPRSPNPIHVGSADESLNDAATTIDQIIFGISSSKNSWPKRKEYMKLWWRPMKMRGCVFLDEPVPDNHTDSRLLPPLCISEDTSRFRYTFPGGHRTAIRIAHAVAETVARFNRSENVRWYVFSDDDTVFVPENLAKTLSKYDHRLWYYVGSNSESYQQNKESGFGTAFGGGGLALSRPLAETLAQVLDPCIQRYPHLYGGDSRIYSCVAELGIGLSHEHGFHQLDVRGNIFGLLTSHPLAPLVSLHHMEFIDPIFPNMSTLEALRHLLEAAKLDPHRILHHSICYDRWFTWTASISWGYAVQISESNTLLPDVLPAQETFRQWKKNSPLSGVYMPNTRPVHPDPCRRPSVFFLNKVSKTRDGLIHSVYKQQFENCSYDMGSPRRLEEVRVHSRRLELGIRELKAPRRQCCDITPFKDRKVVDISIRQCKDVELIYMHP